MPEPRPHPYGAAPRVPRRQSGRPSARVQSRPVHVAAFGALLVFCFCAASYLLPLQEVAMIGAVGVLGITIVLGRHQLVLGGRPGFLLLLYGVFVAFSVPTSIWLGPSINGAIETAKFLIIFIVTVNTVTTRRRAVVLIGCLVLLITVFPALGAIQYYLADITKEPGRANWRGLFGNANMVALTMLMHLPFAVALYASDRRAAPRLLWGAVIALLVTVTVLTKSRAGFLALLGLAGAGVSLARKRSYAVAAVAAAAVIIVVTAPADFKDRLATIFSSERDYSAESRTVFWRVAIDLALSHPITGIGVDTYPRALAQRAPRELGTAGGLLWQDTHSTYLNIWAEIGTPGFVVFVGALVTLLALSWRTLRATPRGDPMNAVLRASIAAMVVFMVMGVFNSFQNAWFFYVLFAIPLAVRPLALSPQPPRLVGTPPPAHAAGLRQLVRPAAPGLRRAPHAYPTIPPIPPASHRTGDPGASPHTNGIT